MSQGQTLPAKDERQPRSTQDKESAATPMKPANKVSIHSQIDTQCS